MLKRNAVPKEELDRLYALQPTTGPLTCQTCSIPQSRNNFRQLTSTKPIIYAPQCKACDSKEQAESLRKELLERQLERRTRDVVKEVTVKRLDAEVRQRRQYRKAKTEQYKATKKAKYEAAKAESEADKELASRVLARRQLLHYIERSMPDYMPGWVHEDICRRLEKFVEQVEQQKSPRLMIWMPPRHGKSEIASVRLPEWVLGKHPEWEFISTSYSADLPLAFSRRIRSRLQEDSYHAMFPHTYLAKDSTSAENWRTTKGGGYRAAGVGGGITGMGAHILLVDDPVKDQEEADSETIRQKVWDWFTTTAYTRLAPGGGVLCIQTRWHDDDLSGRLEHQMYEILKERQEEKDEIQAMYRSAVTAEAKKEADWRWSTWARAETTFDRWEIIKYPAIATANEYLSLESGRISAELKSKKTYTGYKLLRKEGEALHPERFALNQLLKYKRTLQPRHWSALYQQNPVPDEGLFFTKDMFRFVPDMPDYRKMYVFVAWDLAVGQRQSNDWTVGVVGALDWKDDLYIIDVLRAKWQSINQADVIIDTHVKYGATLTGIEKGVLEMALRPHLDRRMKERRQYIPLAEGDSALKPVTDKIVRARPLQGRMQQGKVLFVHGQPWLDTVQQELLRFPGALHDDIVDGMAWLVRMVLNQGPPPEPKKVVKYKSWRDRIPSLTTKRHWMGA